MKITKRNSDALRYLTRAAVIGALYAALTMMLTPFSFGALQFRISEAMSLLPLFFPEAIPGLFVGCAIANIITPNIPVLDVIFGSLATLAAAFLTSKMRSLRGIKRALAAPLPPVIINAVVIGAVITISEVKPGDSFLPLYLLNALSVGAGQAVVCYLLGIPLIFVIERIQDRLRARTGAEL
ncbi:MAG: QueT transporter family protein [Eubacteriales bacterium]|jgi:uncharacterized membrane protein|nr:QueT transporter family protein [Eubacteriales bacterium]